MKFERRFLPLVYSFLSSLSLVTRLFVSFPVDEHPRDFLTSLWGCRRRRRRRATFATFFFFLFAVDAGGSAVQYLPVQCGASAAVSIGFHFHFQPEPAAAARASHTQSQTH